MDFETWEPVYKAILEAFGYPRNGDEHARDQLGAIVESAQTYQPDRLGISGSTVAIAGAGPSLEQDTRRAATADVVIAASTAVDRLSSVGITVDAMVTDMDKNPETGKRLTATGVPVFVHAHGDNMQAVTNWIPEYDHEYVVPTTQAAPSEHVRNFGGFTDGDRAAFIADQFGAESIQFVGWDFDDSTVSPTKARKLQWAKRLLHWLETRRDERFELLTGQRDDIEAVNPLNSRPD
jgi:uncharacterized Rossmann fold enzyme